MIRNGYKTVKQLPRITLEDVYLIRRHTKVAMSLIDFCQNGLNEVTEPSLVSGVFFRSLFPLALPFVM